MDRLIHAQDDARPRRRMALAPLTIAFLAGATGCAAGVTVIFLARGPSADRLAAASVATRPATDDTGRAHATAPPPLHLYQMALDAPSPAVGRLDPAAAARGGRLFEGRADCVRCHVADDVRLGGLRTPFRAGGVDAVSGLLDGTQGDPAATADGLIRADVVAHYDRVFAGLTDAERVDIIEFLKCRSSAGEGAGLSPATPCAVVLTAGR
jgi:hypothetical protein